MTPRHASPRSRDGEFPPHGLVGSSKGGRRVCMQLLLPAPPIFPPSLQDRHPRCLPIWPHLSCAPSDSPAHAAFGWHSSPNHHSVPLASIAAKDRTPGLPPRRHSSPPRVSTVDLAVQSPRRILRLGASETALPLLRPIGSASGPPNPSVPVRRQTVGKGQQEALPRPMRSFHQLLIIFSPSRVPLAASC